MAPNQEKCKQIVGQIQSLSPLEIDELFKIIHRSSCEYTTNNNGVFINLSWVSDETLSKIEDFITFCHQSSNELEKFETIRSEYKQDIIDYRHGTDNVSVLTLTDEEPKHVPSVLDGGPILDECIVDTEPEFIPEPEIEIEPADGEKKSKVSSTMKFYLLKKKYSKCMATSVYAENELTHETYIM